MTTLYPRASPFETSSRTAAASEGGAVGLVSPSGHGGASVGTLRTPLRARSTFAAMSDETRFGDVGVTRDELGIAVVTIGRPPDNYFDIDLIASLGDAYEGLDADPAARAIVLRAEGKHFCAGARLAAPREPATGSSSSSSRHLYDEALRLFACRLPVVAAIQGAAVGGGLGLALSADFRIGTAQSRMSANFARLGFHHGFALTVTLPAVVGRQRAHEMLLTGARLDGTEAHRIGLLDRLVAADQLEEATRAFAAEIAASGPLAVRSIRETMRRGLVDEVRDATARERAEQERLMVTADFAEGVAATRERRVARFRGA
jgi:enoyl-CoA hydratase/carnithine racemase